MKTRANRTEVKTKVTGSLVIDDRFRLINISDSGALIITSQKLLLNNIYFLRFDFRDSNKLINLKLKSQVMREKLSKFEADKKGGKVPIYEIGLSFCDTSPSDIKKLKVLIAQKELMKVRQ